MANRPKDKGTWAEVRVAKYLERYWPHAERKVLTGAFDKGDITGTPLIAWEVKFCSAHFRMAEWLQEAAKEKVNARADYCPLIIKPPGLGEKSVQHWYAALSGEEMARLVHDAQSAAIEAGLHLEIVHEPVLAQTTPNIRKQMAALAAAELGGPFWRPVPMAAFRPPSTGEDSGRWVRMTTLERMTDLLCLAGYGTAPNEGVEDARANEPSAD